MNKLDKKALKNFNRFLKNKYLKRMDKDNVLPIGITDEEFVRFIIPIVLGEDWYVSMSMSHNQVNEEALCSILDKLDKKWRAY